MKNFRNSSLDLSGFTKVAILGNDLPRQCGIATFTSHLVSSLTEQYPQTQFDIVAMSDQKGYAYAPRVRHEIEAESPEAYPLAAKFINDGGYDVLLVQHEYGIFGGPNGSYLVEMLREVNIPIVITLHTVLRQPSDGQRSVLQDLLQLCERVVVMSVLAVKILEDLYSVSKDTIDVIPHGMPEPNRAATTLVKDRHGIKGLMLFTFGLLSPDKGIQYAIKAMPRILESDPEAVYVVLGATHPQVRATAGESYRESLLALTKELGVEQNVIFVDRFVDEDELVAYLYASDVYITPYLNPRQITSGTLAYALGAGKAVISTPYLYAQELLGGGRGTLVGFKNEDDIADGVLRFIDPSGSAPQIVESDCEYCRPMKWSMVSRGYFHSLSAARDSSRQNLSAVNFGHDSYRLGTEVSTSFPIPSLNLAHLKSMTDNIGLYQHAKYQAPDLDHGYCVDDNARSLMLTAYLEGLGPLDHGTHELQAIYLRFLGASFNPDYGIFRNFMSSEGDWLEERGSNDSHARTLWALGTMVGRTKSVEFAFESEQLFWKGIPAVLQMDSPRTWAFAILGLLELGVERAEDARAKSFLGILANRLWTRYRVCRRDDWRWFEESVTYENARLSQALFLAGKTLQAQGMIADGLESLNWLMTNQTSDEGYFDPIGSDGFWIRGQKRARFDQQPVEAWGAIAACTAASKITGDPNWQSLSYRGLEWFLGGNALGLPIWDETSGGCRDGLHQDRVNENQGAESTLSFLFALVEIELAKRSARFRSAWSLR